MAASNSEFITQRQKVYAYKLIKFVDESDDNADTDFVPAAWVHYDDELQDICTRFMPPPYNTKNTAVLHTMIKTKISPPDSWPKYRIEIRGEAETHADAVKKVDKLRREKYAFSTDCEENAMKKSFAAKKLYFKQKQTDPVEIEKLMNVTPLPDKDTDAAVVIQEYDSSSSTSIVETTNSKTRRKRQARISSDSAGHRRFDKSSSSSRDGFKGQEPNTAESSSTLQSTTPRGKKMLQTKQATATGVDKVGESSAETVAGTSKKVIKPSMQLNEDDSEISIMRYLRSLAIQQTKTTEAITELKRLVEALGEKLNLRQTENAMENQPREMTLAENLGITFPLQNLEDFERFDVALKNPTLIELLRKEMLCLMEMKMSLQRNIGNILKKYMARDLLRSYTAVKKTAGKGVLKSTNLYQRIQENITSEYSKNLKLSPISDKKFGDAVGAVINSAKDWEGRRLLRSTKGSFESNEAPTKETASRDIAAEETDKAASGEVTTKNSKQI